MAKEHKKRLNRLRELIRVLEDVPKRQFEMSTVREDIVHGSEENFENKSAKDVLNLHACKSVACAMGWAASDPWFQKRGFKLHLDGASDIYVGRKQRVELSYDVIYKPKAELKTFYSFAAAREFFGLTESETHELFSSAGYPYDTRITPKMVIQKVKELMVRYNMANPPV